MPCDAWFAGKYKLDVDNDGLLRRGVECTSEDEFLGEYVSLEECKAACGDTSGCEFYIFGKDDKYGQCYWEKTTSAQCPEGFREDASDFYAMDPSANPSWESTPNANDVFGALAATKTKVSTIQALRRTKCWNQWPLTDTQRAAFEAFMSTGKPCHKIYGGRAVIGVKGWEDMTWSELKTFLEDGREKPRRTRAVFNPAYDSGTAARPRYAASSILGGPATPGQTNGSGRLGDETSQWIAASNNSNQWWQIDTTTADGDPRIVTGAITECSDAANCVTSWEMQYCDTPDLDSCAWKNVDNGKVYTGGQKPESGFDFETSVAAYGVRFVPHAWNGYISARMALRVADHSTPRDHANIVWELNAESIHDEDVRPSTYDKQWLTDMTNDACWSSWDLSDAKRELIRNHAAGNPLQHMSEWKGGLWCGDNPDGQLYPPDNRHNNSFPQLLSADVRLEICRRAAEKQGHTITRSNLVRSYPYDREMPKGCSVKENQAYYNTSNTSTTNPDNHIEIAVDLDGDAVDACIAACNRHPGCKYADINPYYVDWSNHYGRRVACRLFSACTPSDVTIAYERSNTNHTIYRKEDILQPPTTEPSSVSNSENMSIMYPRVTGNHDCNYKHLSNTNKNKCVDKQAECTSKFGVEWIDTAEECLRVRGVKETQAPFFTTTGNCKIKDACVTSSEFGNTRGYTDTETCTITINNDGILNAQAFSLRYNSNGWYLGTGYDNDTMTVGGTTYRNTTGPSNLFVEKGDTIQFTAGRKYQSYQTPKAGFNICFRSFSQRKEWEGEIDDPTKPYGCTETPTAATFNRNKTRMHEKNVCAGEAKCVCKRTEHPNAVGGWVLPGPGNSGLTAPSPELSPAHVETTDFAHALNKYG